MSLREFVQRGAARPLKKYGIRRKNPAPGAGARYNSAPRAGKNPWQDDPHGKIGGGSRPEEQGRRRLSALSATLRSRKSRRRIEAVARSRFHGSRGASPRLAGGPGPLAGRLERTRLSRVGGGGEAVHRPHVPHGRSRDGAPAPRVPAPDRPVREAPLAAPQAEIRGVPPSHETRPRPLPRPRPHGDERGRAL